MPDPGHPFPQLQIYPGSGLTFPWAEVQDGLHSSFEMNFGASEGVGLGMTIAIPWNYLPDALQQLLGYARLINNPAASEASPNFPKTIINRQLPWRCPYADQLFVRRITRVLGIRLEGKAFGQFSIMMSALPTDGGGSGGGAGGGSYGNVPSSQYHLAYLTLQFWRPPYFVRSDSDVVNGGQPLEWLRYVERRWEFNTEMLSREGSTFFFLSGQGLPSGRYFQGSVGQKLSRTKMKLIWHQVPMLGIFPPGAIDFAPTNIPRNLLYKQTATINPITGYVEDPQIAAGIPTVFFPIQGCVNAPIGGGAVDGSGNYLDPSQNRFFGCPAGTLLLESISLDPSPLQMPAELMGIPLTNREPLAQLQYDVTFHFEFFDPPRVQQANGQISSVQILSPGNGVVNPVNLQFGGGGSSANGYVLTSGGQVTDVIMLNGGSGYSTPGPVTLTVGGAGGSVGDGTFLGEIVVLGATPKPWYRGHNLMPFSGNGFWYAVAQAQAPITTPFQYADFADLFKMIPDFEGYF